MAKLSALRREDLQDSSKPQEEVSMSALAGGSATELDRLIHERMRLGIVSALAVNEQLSFNELKTMLGLTDGNLSVHARRLEEADYLEVDKSFQGKIPCTQYRLTRKGKRALEQYLEHMESLIESVRGAQ